ncbi:energy-coupling factor ABC transporter ATP-binding protein [Brucella gallinifaecis]|uniref:energy-coupling factor ABC transporter ATP-binding protein n=1 Tax=Brucella gallinifaecis TaxID=215590 RepID=UPI002361A38D|nr:ABC transporter ATP-binding protein [Brucella gallinifaecis]
MIIHFENACVRHDQYTALHPLTISISEKRIGIIGLNGSGKSTFARLIAGLEKASSGNILLENTHLNGRVGYIFQNPANQIIMPVIQDDIEFGLKKLVADKNMRAEMRKTVLARLNAEYLATRRVHELSGGELQLAALASVLVTEPELIIFDEPTNQLDLKNRGKVEQIISRLRQQTIVISHDLQLVESYDRVLVFHEGRIVEDASPSIAIARYMEIAN